MCNNRRGLAVASQYMIDKKCILTEVVDFFLIFFFLI